MIRETYLNMATRSNLYGLHLIRDAAAILQTGVRAGETIDLLDLERIKVSAEALLEKAIVGAEGFVSDLGDTGFLTQYTANCEARTTLLNVTLKLPLAAAERQVLKSGANPPVGMRGTLFEYQKELSALSAETANALTDYIARVQKLQSEGRKCSGFSLTLLETVRGICADYAVAALAFSLGEGDGFLCRTETIERLAAEAEKSIDASEEKLLEWICAERMDSLAVLTRLAAASAGGALKSTLPPLYFDFSFRYALSVKGLTSN